MPEPLLAALVQADLTRELLINVITEHLKGKRYLPYEEGKVYDCGDDQHELWMEELNELQQKEKALRDSVIEFIISNRDRLLSQGEQDHHARKGLNPLIDKPELWLENFQAKKDNKYAARLFPDVLSLCSDCDDANKRLQKQWSQ